MLVTTYKTTWCLSPKGHNQQVLHMSLENSISSTPDTPTAQFDHQRLVLEKENYKSGLYTVWLVVVIVIFITFYSTMVEYECN
jgi:hypothetical protein